MTVCAELVRGVKSAGAERMVAPVVLKKARLDSFTAGTEVLICAFPKLQVCVETSLLRRFMIFPFLESYNPTAYRYYLNKIVLVRHMLTLRD